MVKKTNNKTKEDKLVKKEGQLKGKGKGKIKQTNKQKKRENKY